MNAGARNIAKSEPIQVPDLENSNSETQKRIDAESQHMRYPGKHVLGKSLIQPCLTRQRQQNLTQRIPGQAKQTELDSPKVSEHPKVTGSGL